MISSRKGGTSLQAKNDSPRYVSLNRGEASYLDQAVTIDGDKLNLFLTNRSTTDALEVTINTDMTLNGVISAEILNAEHAKTVNDYDRPDEVVAKPLDGVDVSGSKVTVTLPPLAFAALTIGVNHD